MAHDPKLLDTLKQYDPRPWKGLVFRHMLGDYQPQLANIRGARWNPPEVAAIYASLDSTTAVAEADYRLSLEPVRPRARRTVYELDISLASVLDLTIEGRLSAVGVSSTELGSEDMEPCQRIGGAAAWLEHDGLLIPSARHEGTNLVIYAANQSPDFEMRIVGGEEIRSGERGSQA